MIYNILCNINLTISNTTNLNLCGVVFRTLSNTYDGDFYGINCFRKKAQ